MHYEKFNTRAFEWFFKWMIVYGALDWIEHCFTSLPVSVFHLETFECETV